MCLQNSVREKLYDTKFYLESYEGSPQSTFSDCCDYIELNDCQNIPINQNDLCVIQMNIRELISKQADVYLTLKSITHMSKVDIDILVETWLTAESESRINIPGYVFVGTPCHHKKGGGVGFLIRENILYTNRCDLCIKSDIIKCSKHNIVLGSLYRPPNTSESEFLISMKSILENHSKINKNRKEIILGMDHNLDLLKHSTHVPTQKFMELLMENRLMPVITRPTCVTNTSAMLLDNIILSMNLYNRYSSSVIMHDISDHFLCLTIISDCKYEEGSTQVPKHKLTEKNISKIKTNLSQINWDFVLSGKDAENSMIAFHEKLISELDKVSPERMTHVSTNQVLNISWMTAGILKCSKKQLLLYKTWLRSNKSEDLQKYQCY